MEIYQLRTFVTVAQQKHLTQAAELLHLSQPAVTAQIKALEKNLDISLFERTAQGMLLTQAGQELFPQAQEILTQMHELTYFAKSLNQNFIADAKIGVINPTYLLRLGEWVPQLMEQHPLLNLRLIHGISGDVLNRVRKKELHAGFFMGNNPYQNIYAFPLKKIEYVVICPIAWANNLINTDKKTLSSVPWIGMSQNSSISKILHNFWRDQNINPKKITECDQTSTALELIRSGLGIGLVRKEDALAFVAKGEVSILEKLNISIKLSFIYLLEHQDDPLLRLLRAAVVQVWEKESASLKMPEVVTS